MLHFRPRSYRSSALPQALFSLILLVILTAVSGCSGLSDSAPVETTTAASDAKQTAKTVESPKSRTVKHLSGETTIVGVPHKIAVLDYRLADSLLALGVKPYAMTTYLGDKNLPYIDGKPLDAALPLGDTPNLEALLQAGPDLIIARRSEEKSYDQLSKIAPTVIVDVPADWRGGFRELGAILQRESDAERWLADYEKKTAKAREDIARYVKPGETFLYLRIMPKEIRVHGTEELFGATLFQDLKLTPVAGLDKVKRIEPISLEMLPQYDADRIFLQVGSPVAGGDKEAEKNLAIVAETSVWKGLKAVKGNRVYTMPHWIISDYPNIKSKSVDLVAEHLKGQP